MQIIKASDRMKERGGIKAALFGPSGMLASIKSALDGIALACAVDDYGWSLSIQRGPSVEGGAVLVHVMKPTAQNIELRGEIG